MSDWVIPLVALVPAVLTALSGLLQPALKSRSDSRAAQAAADRERFVSRYDDAVALLILSRASSQTGPAEPASPEAPR